MNQFGHLTEGEIVHAGAIARSPLPGKFLLELAAIAVAFFIGFGFGVRHAQKCPAPYELKAWAACFDGKKTFNDCAKYWPTR